MKINNIILSILVAVSLASCAEETEKYVLQNPSAPVAEARLELEGSTATLTVRYTDDSTSILSAAIQRSNASPQTFILGFDSLPKKKFEFNTIPQLKTGILKCAECLDMSAISSLKSRTSLVEWKRAADV